MQPSCYGFDQGYLLDSVKAYPGKFVGVVMLDPNSEDVAGHLKYWAEEHRMQGVRLPLSPVTDVCWLAFPPGLSLLKRALEVAIPVCSSIHPEQLSKVEVIVSRFPTLRLIIDHMGPPVVDEEPPYLLFRKLLEPSKYPNTYIKVSGLYPVSKGPYPHHDTDRLVRAVCEYSGPNWMMWGSDCPLGPRDASCSQPLDLMQK